MWCVILIPFIVRDGEYGNGVGVIFCCKSSPMYGSFCFFFIVGVGVSNSFSFIGICMSNRSKYLISRE